MKELFIAAHEELIERYLERHPEATEAQAYEATADRAYDRMTDNLADRADYLRKAVREGQEKYPASFVGPMGRHHEAR